MIKLLPITVIGIVLAVFSHLNSERDLKTNAYVYKEKLFYVLMSITLIFFVGLRTAYNDTYTYKQMYSNLLLNNSSWSDIDWDLGSNPGFWVINTLLSKLNVSVQNFLMIYAAVTVGIYLWFIRKYTNNIWLSIVLFFLTGTYTFSLAAIKQCVAVAFCLVATDRAIKKKWWAFLLWVLIAATFHPYSLMYLCVPFLTFCPGTAATYVMLAIFAALGVGLESMLGTIVDITSMMGEEYDASSFTGEGVNPFRLLVCAVPLVLSFVAKKSIAHKNDRVQNLFINLAILNAEIMFIGLFGTANYFARLANYFLFFQVLSLPVLINHFDEKAETILTSIAVVCYSVFYYYSNAVFLYFDYDYRSITVFEYIKSLF